MQLALLLTWHKLSTLERIANGGSAAFYKGQIGKICRETP